MATPLTVEFDGITPLLPKKDAGSDCPADQWLAVLPDLQETFGPIEERIPRAVAPHVACIVVPDEAVDVFGTDKSPRLIFRSRSDRFGDRLYRLYFFDREKLSIDSGVPPEDRRLVASFKDFAYEAPRKLEERYNLGWVAPLKKAGKEMGLKDAGVFNQRLLTDDDRPNPNWRNDDEQAPLGLVGTVLFDHGKLTTDSVVTYDKDGQQRVGVYEFRPEGGTGGHRQTQADHIVLKDSVAAHSITLEFHGTRDRIRLVKLRPIGGEFKVWVFNLELETILDVGEGTNPDDGSDPDFAVCYALSKGWPFPETKGPLPIPFPTWTEVGGSRKTCNPGQFAGGGT